MKQAELFGSLHKLPEGLVYKSDSITRDEEDVLLNEITKLSLHEAKYKEYTAKRRIISYGGAYDFASNELIPAGPIPPFLNGLLERISRWTGIAASRFTRSE